MMNEATASTATEKPVLCTKCNVRCKDAEHLRQHSKTDWHILNVKRKIASLPILTAEQYIKKINKLKEDREKEEAAKKEKIIYRCNDCKKTFSANSTYVDHLNSKKHKQTVKNIKPKDVEPVIKAPSIKVKNDDVEVEDEEEVDSDEWDEDTEINYSQCFFCSNQSINFLSNLEHMTSVHSFFIRDVEYCTDVEGLLRYLAEKVSKYYMCLLCNEKGRTFYSAEAAKNHMVDKGHCRMIYEGDALTEYVDFYDYSSTYPDEENDKDVDEEVPVNILDGSDYHLILPSGATIGHRSLLRYYKQNTSRLSAVVPSKNTKKLHKVLATYRALGWSQAEQEQAARRARDIHYLKRLKSKWNTKMGIKNNKFQKHFRQQVNF